MFKKFFQRLRVDERQERAAAISAWAKGQEGATAIRKLAAREVATVAGVVDLLRVRPREGGYSFEAEITDGTGTVTAIWLGRRTIPGLSIGTRIVVEGRFGGDGHQLQVMNPTYEFTPGDEVH